MPYAAHYGIDHTARTVYVEKCEMTVTFRANPSCNLTRSPNTFDPNNGVPTSQCYARSLVSTDLLSPPSGSCPSLPFRSSLFRYRGTLRYNGFCNLLNECRSFGLLETSNVEGSTLPRTWGALVTELTKKNGGAEIEPRLKAALDWLDATGERPMDGASDASTIDAFCALLEEKLTYVCTRWPLHYIMRILDSCSPYLTCSPSHIHGRVISPPTPSGTRRASATCA